MRQTLRSVSMKWTGSCDSATPCCSSLSRKKITARTLPTDRPHAATASPGTSSTAIRCPLTLSNKEKKSSVGRAGSMPWLLSSSRPTPTAIHARRCGRIWMLPSFSDFVPCTPSKATGTRRSGSPSTALGGVNTRPQRPLIALPASDVRPCTRQYKGPRPTVMQRKGSEFQPLTKKMLTLLGRPTVF